MNHESKEFHFFSFYDSNYSRSGTFLTGLFDYNLEVNFHKVRSQFRRTIQDLRVILNTTNRNSHFIILSGSSLIAVYLRLIGCKNIMLDAGWSSFEATKGRDYGFLKPLVLAKLYSLELIAFWSSARIFVESQSQRSYISRIFLIPKRRIFVLPTGVNEQAFTLARFTNEIDSLGEITKEKFLFFRGKNVSESGLDVIARSTWLVKSSIKFVIVTDSVKSSTFNPTNSFILEGYQDYAIIKFLYEKATAILGQISRSKRLRNTIPHKAFEAAFFAKPYITLQDSAVLELFAGESVIGLDNSDPKRLAKLCDWIAKHPVEVERKGLNFGQEYLEKYQQRKLQRDFLKLIAI